MQIVSRLEAREARAGEHRPVLIACLGDSVTHGCFEMLRGPSGEVSPRYAPDEGYVARLERRLRAKYPAACASVLNAGVSGENAHTGLRRLERDALFARPDLLIVNFALNDAMNPDVESGLNQYAQAMRAIFERALDAGCECMLLTPNFMCAHTRYAYENDWLRDVAHMAALVQNEGVLARYVDAAREVARSLGLPIADAYARWQTLADAGMDTTALLANAINHPTPQAHELFVDAICDVLFPA